MTHFLYTRQLRDLYNPDHDTDFPTPLESISKTLFFIIFKEHEMGYNRQQKLLRNEWFQRISGAFYCVKNIQIWEFFWSVSWRFFLNPQI